MSGSAAGAGLTAYQSAPLEQPEPLGEQGPADPGDPPWISLKPLAPTMSSRMTSGVHRSPSTSTPAEIGQ